MDEIPSAVKLPGEEIGREGGGKKKKYRRNQFYFMEMSCWA